MFNKIVLLLLLTIPSAFATFGIVPGGQGVPATRTINTHPLSANVTVTKGDVGLGNVDNTSDVNKPVSTAQQTELDTKEPSISVGTTLQYWRGDKSFQSLVSADIPASIDLTGLPTAPTASPGTSTMQLATTAFVLSQGFLNTIGAMPVGSSSTLVTTTSASTTFVNALTTTVTVTASSAPVMALCILDLTSATAASVATVRVTINAVAGGSVTESLTVATTQHLTVPNQYVSAALGPGTYTVNCEFNRASGTGTVTVAQGSLRSVVLQGASSNGITQITGALQAGPGSGSQVLSGVLPVANGGTALSSTTINRLLYSSANNVIAGLATANTGALVTSSTGVPSITSGATANRLLRTNGTTVSFAQVAADTDISGTLPVANGGTGLTAAFAASRAMFSNGTTLAADGLYQYQTANTRLFVGQGGGTGRINGTVGLTDPTPNDLAGNFYSRTTANNAVNIQNENTLVTLNMTNSGGSTIGANIRAQASQGTLVARTQTQPSDALFSITAQGRTASAWSTGYAAAMSIVSTEAVTGTTNGGEIVFSTTPNGSATPIERLRITNDGLVKSQKGFMNDTSGSQPSCSSSSRGLTWVIQGGAGVADIFQVCLKDASDVYNWVTK